MTSTEFQKRAYASGVDIRVSGQVFFFSREGVTVRVRLEDRVEPHYAIAHIVKGKDIAYMTTTVHGASKALKLPRR